MLNELFEVERSVKAAGFDVVESHPSIKEARKIPTLLVTLAPDGSVFEIRPLPPDFTPWTLRDGQHNSFPFVQPSTPLWSLPESQESARLATTDKNKKDNRRALLDLASSASLNPRSCEKLTSKKFLRRTCERLEAFQVLRGTEAEAVPATLERFLRACDPKGGGNPLRLFESISTQLISKLKSFSEASWTEVGLNLLLGKFEKGTWSCGGALYFDAADVNPGISDSRLITAISRALRDDSNSRDTSIGRCALTGEKTRLHTGNFPQPNLPGLGQTYLFAKNRAIQANDRYGRFASDAYPVGEDTIIRIEGGLSTLTNDAREGKTWATIPGEAPKQTDLLVAYIEEDPTASPTEIFVQEDFEEENRSDQSEHVDSIGQFQSLTKQVFEALRGRARANHTDTHLRIFVLRKLDPANRKVVYAGVMTLEDLAESAWEWEKGERNLPPWFRLLIYNQKASKGLLKRPPHVAPLGLIKFSKAHYVRSGEDRQEVTGLSSYEAMGIFATRRGNSRLLHDFLRAILKKRSQLVVGTVHTLRKGLDYAKGLDRREALRTATVLGLVLYKLGRRKDEYMSETAFKIGKLLAAVDEVHVGYCLDVRGAEIPPCLLGNQLLGMAQRNPKSALRALLQRWRPYHAWITRAHQDFGRFDEMIEGKRPYPRGSRIGRRDAVQDGFTIKRALRCGRAIAGEAEKLHGTIDVETVDDIFLAELLLGYMAGIPRAKDDDEPKQASAQQTAAPMEGSND